MENALVFHYHSLSYLGLRDFHCWSTDIFTDKICLLTNGKFCVWLHRQSWIWDLFAIGSWKRLHLLFRFQQELKGQIFKKLHRHVHKATTGTCAN